MTTELDRAGTFRGRIVEYGLVEVESGAKAISLVAEIDDAWDQEMSQWADWREYRVVARGAVWVIKKDGTLNQRAVESLIQQAGWNGDLVAVVNGEWTPKPCQFEIKAEAPSEKNKRTETAYRIAWLNAYDRVPGAVGNVTPERAKELQAQYGASFRALAGNAVRNAPAAPAGKPPIPKGPNRRPVQQAALANAAQTEQGDTSTGEPIPF